MAADARRNFSFRVALRADEVWELLCAREDVRISDEPAPAPPPPRGAPYLAARPRPDQFRLRRWAGDADAVSPVIVVDVDEDDRGCTVYGHFERGRSGSLAESTTSYRKYIPPVAGILVALSIGGAVLGGWWAAILLPVLLVLFALPAGAVMVPMLMLWNQQSRIEQTESLWGLVGKVFTPLALPEGEEPDPFR
ncbi:MAG: hypothetical protein AAGA54_08410 [Myxococcota bacterium]